MTTWAYRNVCRDHQEGACDCSDVLKMDLWRLTDDRGNEIGAVMRFDPEGPFYGMTTRGRSGAVGSLSACQARVEQLLLEQVP